MARLVDYLSWFNVELARLAMVIPLPVAAFPVLLELCSCLLNLGILLPMTTMSVVTVVLPAPVIVPSMTTSLHVPSLDIGSQGSDRERCNGQ
jgi:hypothetical protein